MLFVREGCILYVMYLEALSVCVHRAAFLVGQMLKHSTQPSTSDGHRSTPGNVNFD